MNPPLEPLSFPLEVDDDVLLKHQRLTPKWKEQLEAVCKEEMIIYDCYDVPTTRYSVR